MKNTILQQINQKLNQFEVNIYQKKCLIAMSTESYTDNLSQAFAVINSKMRFLIIYPILIGVIILSLALIKESFLYICVSIPIIFFSIILIAILLVKDLVFYFNELNQDRLKINKKYYESQWWINTNIYPSEIVNDESGGLYGEYIATIAAEKYLRDNHLKGYIFNNVIIPKENTDGDFSEIDVLSINETGIHVIEAKAKRGYFYGCLQEKNWTQQLGNHINATENPVIQNVNHCNTLVNYLYNCFLKEDSQYFDHELPITNVVLFCKTDAQIEISNLCQNSNICIPSYIPYRTFIGSANYIHRDSYFCYDSNVFYQNMRNNFTGSLSNNEMAVLKNIIESRNLCSHSREERKRMYDDRYEKQKNNLYGYGKVKYYSVNIDYKGINGKYFSLKTICRDNGIDKTYCFKGDGLFRTMPYAKKIKRIDNTDYYNLETALWSLKNNR